MVQTKKASSAHRRSLLHKDKLIFFEHWALLPRNGYIKLEKTNHPYEVLRLRKYSPNGDNPDIFFYKRLGTDHITLSSYGEALVKKWLKESKTPQDKLLRMDKHYDERWELLEAVHNGHVSVKQFFARMKDMGFNNQEASLYLDGDV